MTRTDKIIVWFRNDLRLHDNEPLYKAAAKSPQVVPVYCFDPRQFAKTPLGLPRTGSYRTAFLLETVQNLRENLRKKGTDLIIRVGRPEEEIPAIAEQTGARAVYATKEITSEEVAVENALEKALARNKVSLALFWQLTLYHLNDLPYPLQSLPDIFTQFRKSVEKGVQIRQALPEPETLKAVPCKPGDIPTLQDFDLDQPEFDKRSVLRFNGGETAAKNRLNDYFWQQDLLKTYKETRNGLKGADYSSKFSAWLANGSLSPRYVYQQVKKYEQERTKNQSTYWLVFELIWRDYFKFVAKKFGSSIFKPGGLRQKPLKLRDDERLFQKWAEGQTGIPFIDANMREINASGFMSNRGRQNVASFLVKDLGINWTWGASYFESLLVDYDPCSNWCNWNYVAGVGNDPRENRYFNIISQAKRYDGKAEYIKHWIPEIEEVPSSQAHLVGELSRKEQEQYGAILGADYPYPVVDNARWLKKHYH